MSVTHNNLWEVLLSGYGSVLPVPFGTRRIVYRVVAMVRRVPIRGRVLRKLRMQRPYAQRGRSTDYWFLAPPCDWPCGTGSRVIVGNGRPGCDGKPPLAGETAGQKYGASPFASLRAKDARAGKGDIGATLRHCSIPRRLAAHSWLADGYLRGGVCRHVCDLGIAQAQWRA